jgi:peroxiredoxin Q/BCP
MAPDFQLQGTDGNSHRLSDFRGKEAVVMAWFPKAYTRGCTIECKSLTENSDLLKQIDMTYFMASVDKIEDNIGFAKQQEADFILLSDPTLDAAKAYEVLGNYGVAMRHTFYIGKNGKILAIDMAVNPATSAEDMAAKLIELGIPSI